MSMSSAPFDLALRRPVWLQIVLALVAIGAFTAFSIWSIASGFDTRGSAAAERRLVLWYAAAWVMSPVCVVSIVIGSRTIIQRGGLLMTVQAGEVELFDGRPRFTLGDIERLVLRNARLTFELRGGSTRELHVGFAEAAARRLQGLRSDLVVFDPGDPHGEIRRAGG